jgi:hypothetical protein
MGDAHNVTGSSAAAGASSRINQAWLLCAAGRIPDANPLRVTFFVDAEAQKAGLEHRWKIKAQNHLREVLFAAA